MSHTFRTVFSNRAPAIATAPTAVILLLHKYNFFSPRVLGDNRERVSLDAFKINDGVQDDLAGTRDGERAVRETVSRLVFERAE